MQHECFLCRPVLQQRVQVLRLACPGKCRDTSATPQRGRHSPVPVGPAAWTGEDGHLPSDSGGSRRKGCHGAGTEHDNFWVLRRRRGRGGQLEDLVETVPTVALRFEYRTWTGQGGYAFHKTKKPSSSGWPCVNSVLGGPGRNRTTDTRIFNLRALSATMDIVVCSLVIWHRAGPCRRGTIGSFKSRLPRRRHIPAP